MNDVDTPKFKFIYIENDGAYFRARTGQFCVDEVWTPDGWKPFAGDRGKPFMEGVRIAEAQVPPFRKPADRKPRVPLNLREGAQDKAFLILSSRGTPPPLPQTTKPTPDAPVEPPKSKAAKRDRKRAQYLRKLLTSGKHPTLIDLTGRTKGQAFQILSARETKKPKPL